MEWCVTEEWVERSSGVHRAKGWSAKSECTKRSSEQIAVHGTERCTRNGGRGAHEVWRRSGVRGAEEWSVMQCTKRRSGRRVECAESGCAKEVTGAGE
jgi:hypothetical protein